MYPYGGTARNFLYLDKALEEYCGCDSKINLAPILSFTFLILDFIMKSEKDYETVVKFRGPYSGVTSAMWRLLQIGAGCYWWREVLPNG